MRTGLAVSVVGHLLLIAWGVFTLATPRPLDISIEAVPVDLIPTGEITKLDRGKETASLVGKPSPVMEHAGNAARDAQSSLA